MIELHSTEIFVQKFEIVLGNDKTGQYLTVIHATNTNQYVVLDTDGIDLAWFDYKSDALSYAKEHSENYSETCEV